MVRKRFLRVLISSFSVAFFLTLTSFSPIRTSAQGAEMLWEQLDVEITILPSGDFWVHETHVFEIPASPLVSIRDVQAWEDG